MKTGWRKVRARFEALRYLLAAALAICPSVLFAQAGTAPAENRTPSWATALPGYWVSLITQNWRMRMVTPAKGDYVGIPLTVQAAGTADAWDPAKDTADGQQCRPYGAAAIMLRPERLHMSWQDSNNLVMDIDAGMQKRIFHFGGHPDATVQPTWQGYSSAVWVARTTPRFVRAPVDAQYLHVTTTRMLPGYLRQNGIPYSGNATLTEDYDLDRVSDQELYLVVTNTVSDPVDLDYPLILTAIFQRQWSDAGWLPTVCSAIW